MNYNLKIIVFVDTTMKNFKHRLEFVIESGFVVFQQTKQQF